MNGICAISVRWRIITGSATLHTRHFTLAGPSPPAPPVCGPGCRQQVFRSNVIQTRQHKYDYLLAVGPGRSGTDFLFQLLRAHPGFAFPGIKEGGYYRSPGRWRRARRHIAGSRLLADISNRAYRDPRLTTRLRDLGEAGVRTLVVVTIRDHVARAESMMLFRASRGEPSAWLGRRFLERRVVADRLNARQLEAICDSGAGVMVVDFDRLVYQTDATLDRLADRCGVAPFAPAGATAAANPSVQARWMPLSAFGKLAAVLLRRAGASSVLQRVKDSPAVRRLFFHGPEVRPARPQISPANRSLLQRENARCWTVVARRAAAVSRDRGDLMPVPDGADS